MVMGSRFQQPGERIKMGMEMEPRSIERREISETHAFAYPLLGLV